MAANIIQLNQEPNFIVKQQINEAENKINEYEKRIEEKILESKQILREQRDKETEEVGVVDRAAKKALAAEIKSLKLRCKKIKDEISSLEESKDIYSQDLAKLRGQIGKEIIATNNKATVTSVFEALNIHYVAFDQAWYSIDEAGDRMEVKINKSEFGVIKDLIFLDTDWELRDEQELKRQAKALNRVYKHIVRDFEKAQRPGVYNQMADIRKFWLTPIFDVAPHDAFRLLTLSVAGGNEEYADQLEKWVGYRYLHPQDVMIPNIDSCAVGGTGRETFYNLCKVIFTETCCTSAGVETFKGTHNGELFGKMFIKIDEKNSHDVPIDVIKELVGGLKYRHRQMNTDARDVIRLFNFLMFRNGFTTTARLAGTGSSGEDRRWEPIIARVNLPRHVAFHYNLIDSINVPLDADQEKAVTVIIKDWQTDYFRNGERVAEWLGHIIKKHNIEKMTELLPLHGVYYTEMINRQKKGIDGFMPRFIDHMQVGETNVIAIKECQELYQIAESVKVSKEWFKNSLMYWLNTKMGWDSEEVLLDTYTFSGCVRSDRRRKVVIRNKLVEVQKPIFNLDDFIDKDSLNDKGTTVGEKINIFSIKESLR